MVHDESTEILEQFLLALKPHEQRKYLNSMITVIVKRHLLSIDESRQDAPLNRSIVISGAAGVLWALIKDSELLKDHVCAVLTKPTLPALDDSLAARRSIVSTIAQDEGTNRSILATEGIDVL